MRNRTLRRWVVVVAALAATVMAFPGPATAADNMPGSPPSSCSGSLLSGFPITKTSGSKTLKLYVYYSSASGGTNCAIVRKSGSWYGQSTDLKVYVWKTTSGKYAAWPNAAYDRGNYQYYAGAAYITGTNGKCISVEALSSAWSGDPLYRGSFACD